MNDTKGRKTAKTFSPFLYACPLLAIAWVSPAYADNQPQGAKAGNEPADIIVTAQRREERLFDVPISIAAYDKSFLESRQISNINDLAGLAPNVKFYSVGYNTNTQISIRGAVQGQTQPFTDPAVGLYLDGAYIGKSAGAVFDVAELERVEVLNGPQGTLYGRNTLAGAINLVTQKPTGRFGGKLEIGIGNFGKRYAQGSLNLPAIGPLSIKLSSLLEKRDGTIDVTSNPFPEVRNALPPAVDELDSLNTKAFRVAMRLAASTNLTLDYTFDYNDTKSLMQYGKLVHLNDGGIFDPASPAYVGGYVGGQYLGLPLDLYLEKPGRSKNAVIDGGPFGQRPFDNLKFTNHNFTATWNLEAVTLKSITAYRDLDADNSIDLDGSPLLVAATNYLGNYKSFSQELQASGGGGSFKYTVGLYYFHDKGNDTGNQQYFGGATTVKNRFWYETTAYAAYGQFDFVPGFLDKLTLTAGLRYSRETKEGSRTSFRQGSGFTIPPGTEGKKTFDAFTPMLTVKYDIDDTANIYVKYARGFKSGGFNLVAPTAAEILIPFKPEIVDAYEIGSKLRLFNGRLNLSAAAFWNEHKDMQLSVFAPISGGTTQTVIRNAGSARVRGFEITAQARPVSWLRLDGSLGYLDAKFKQYNELGVNVAKDRPVPSAPKWTASVSAEATLWDSDHSAGRIILDYRHSDSYYQYPYSLTIDPRLGQNANIAKPDATDIVNARFNISNIKMGTGSAEISLWVDNVFDQKYLMSGINFGPSFGGLAIGYYGRPRSYGLNLKYTFD
ncbi:TonB-dependent receptor [Caenibius sp. WL]|uniref:TonB-dependent receptor n=1 Tax=Caenibius sp. WL TaxID=2872646 RepID=UPI001C9A0944|nr:TonB-dependent receptor [Caenibius sp. WL]QZP08963.1 TonB-dependent receptor [Caenibius sp. WL]